MRESILLMLGSTTPRAWCDPNLGLPITDYGVRAGVQIGVHVNPLDVALYACKILNLEDATGPIVIPDLEGIAGSEYVDRAVKWLLANQTRTGNLCYWANNFPFPPSEMRTPWKSALTEAFGSLLLLVAGKTQWARRHLVTMLTDYSTGGVADVGEDSIRFLEYPSDTRSVVLNGMMHCLLILHECSIILKDDTLRRNFEIGFRTLKGDLGRFDAGFYTFYDSRKNPADEKYHRIHIKLLRLLYEKTQDPELLPYLSRWSAYMKTYPVMEPLIFLRHLIRSGGRLYI